MKIVIDIDKDYYEIMKHDVNNGMDYLPCVLIAKGTPLPKNHGRLIDEDQIPGNNGWDFSDRLMATPTLIEAESDDKE